VSRLVMLPCASYLRVYEPLSAFGEGERSFWAAYAAREDRPRRANALEAEHLAALYRIIALPPIVAPVQESGDAYVRWAGGHTYICPWQTRLRSWLALSQLSDAGGPLLASAGGSGQAEAAAADFARCGGKEGSPRVYIRSSTWAVPLAWFVPFAPTERWLVIGAARDAGCQGKATAAATRTLIYATAMAQARRRIARALTTIRRAPDNSESDRCAPATAAMVRACADLEEIGRWLEEFHPHSLVELDYGGLVQLLDDDALRADQSVAEVSAAVIALASKEFELAAAMYQRLRTRWRGMEAAEHSS
jgi:hypothetical protein